MPENFPIRDDGRGRAKLVIAAIIAESNREIKGKTRLYKAFYFAHLYHAQRTGDWLTHWPIVRMPKGPGIDEGDSLLRELIDEGVITSEPANDGPYPTTTYCLRNDPEPLEAEAVESIRLAASFIDGRSATELSEISHEYSNSWNVAKNGEELNIFLDLLTEEEFAERQEISRNIASALDRVLGCP